VCPDHSHTLWTAVNMTASGNLVKATKDAAAAKLLRKKYLKVLAAAVPDPYKTYGDDKLCYLRATGWMMLDEPMLRTVHPRKVLPFVGGYFRNRRCTIAKCKASVSFLYT
jgi:hypothetical protein